MRRGFKPRSHPNIQPNYHAAYVALSRATRMETLQVLNFDSSKYVCLLLLYMRLLTGLIHCAHRVRAHPRVLEWTSEHTPKMSELPDNSEDELEYWGDTV